MKFLKKVLMLIVALAGILLIIALFVKKDFEISRTIAINKPKSEVFEYLKYLKNQSNFTVWQEMDPNVKQNYKGTDGTVGAVYSWNSKIEDVGAGEQEITKIKDNNRIDFEVRFTKPWESVGQAYFITEDIDNSTDKTKVTWGFSGRSPWPLNLFLLFKDMEIELGPDLEKGLNNLKVILETKE